MLIWFFQVATNVVVLASTTPKISGFAETPDKQKSSRSVLWRIVAGIKVIRHRRRLA